MSTDTYNGWKNRETWALNLWLTSDEGLYRWALDVAAEALVSHRLDHGGEDLPGIEARIVGEAIREAWRELLEECPSESLDQVRDDVGSLWRVDFDAIGEAFCEALECEGVLEA